MSFSSVLGGVGSVVSAGAAMYGARLSANAAQNALEEQRQARFEQARQAQRDYETMLRQLQRERDISDYYRTTNDRNAGLAIDQRDYERGIAQTNFALARDDRAYTMDRQGTLDRAAAERRAFDLQQLLRNQGLSQNERQTALNELRQAQAVARGERVFSEAELRRAQAQREGERAYDMDRQERAQRIAEEERGISMEDRDRVLGRTGEMFDALRSARADLGEIAPTRRFTEADIDAEAGRRAGIYTNSIDRAVDRVASIGEAGLIRQGVDRSSTGNAARGAIAERVAPLYEDAYRRAADDALKYISGTQGVLFAGDNQEAGRRGRVLSEIAGMYGAPLQFESRLPELRSAQGQNLNVASAVYDRNLGSANDYRAPLQVGSSIYEPRNMDAGVANMLPMTLARFDAARSSGVNPAFQQLPFSSPTGFLNASNAASNAAFGAAGSNARTLLEASRADNAAAGRSLESLFTRGGDWLDRLWGSSGSNSGMSGLNFSALSPEAQNIFTTYGRDM